MSTNILLWPVFKGQRRTLSRVPLQNLINQSPKAWRLLPLLHNWWHYHDKHPHIHPRKPEFWNSVAFPWWAVICVHILWVNRRYTLCQASEIIAARAKDGGKFLTQRLALAINKPEWCSDAFILQACLILEGNRWRPSWSQCLETYNKREALLTGNGLSPRVSSSILVSFILQLNELLMSHRSFVPASNPVTPGFC